MARKHLGAIEAQYMTRVMLADRKAREELAAKDTTPKDEVRLMSPQGIRAVASGIPDNERVPDSVMIDTILRDYWRMTKPDRKALLRTYRERCGCDLPTHWKYHHAQLAAFLECLLGQSGIA